MSEATAERLPAHVGDTFTKRLRLSDAEIRAFARSVDDLNPLHHDAAFAVTAGYPGLIASGTHVGSVLMAMTATHYSTPLADGTPRSSLGLGFQLSFRGGVVADEDMELRWTVAEVVRKESLRGWITRLDGDAGSARGRLLSARGEILLRLGDELVAARPAR
jgi:3-hydroxybutyryl-CoA dehydratase